MMIRQGIRPGGRSERVQKAVHAAVKTLVSTGAEAEVTIPMIAAEAGVTPSTIYRRWGSLTELLADVAVERLRPDADPVDTGSFRGDLEAWLEQYAEEISSGPGRAMMRDVLASAHGPQLAGKCTNYTVAHLDLLVARAERRGERTPAVDRLIDGLVAPILYRILFVGDEITADYAKDLLRRTLDDTTDP
ncbi:TetR family transcriptional regulator [Aureimonas endophytica]|uniref:TetR family transcriptional regulator n=1 Tax=Aureimonas endophytica TaxID=2027858 RepID=A0A916ZNW6_9HYPH|nr:TetR/AcrR family transcriptional regulator [Aureimonas endophytica]GGE05742.1 TetR family transcriptional regulator [Aureimonas endophytica]